MTADPKPVKRHKASRAEWNTILRRDFEHACCVSCGLPYQHLHHICFRKADSGDDVTENLAPMCNPCHERFHKRSPGWEHVAAHIRSYVLARASRHLYVIDKIGEERFRRRYPVPTFLSLGDLAHYTQPDALLREDVA